MNKTDKWLKEALQGGPQRASNKKVDVALHDLAFTGGWQVLREEIIEPKIKALLAEGDLIGQVVKGELSLREFGFRTLANRIAAGHLIDIIRRVEAAQEIIEKQAEAKKGVKKKK